MASKYQIFVSSTFDDLQTERDQVIKAILEMGHIPVGMEMFSAADEEQWQIIKRHIDESDYYVVIVAHRYGSITDGISFTRKEYEYAVAAGVPALGFVIDKSARWPADRVDIGDDAERLEDFKKLVSQKPVGFWKNVDDLHGKVSIALSKAFVSTPREGWVRASAAVGPAVTAELTRLSAENAQLRAQVESSEKDTAAEREKEFEDLRIALRGQKRRTTYRYVGEREWRNDAKAWTLNDIFIGIAPMLIPEYSVKACARLLAMTLAKDQEKQSDIVPLNGMKELLTEIMALDLVEPSTRRHSVQDDSEYWSLTTRGKDYLKWINLRYFDGVVKRQKEQVARRQASANSALERHDAAGAALTTQGE